MSALPEKRPIHFPLDIHKMPVGPDGIHNFFWPVSYKQRETVCNALIKSYPEILNEYGAQIADQNDPSLLSYKILAKYFITEVLSVFNSDLLREEFAKSPYQPQPKQDWRLWNTLFYREEPTAPNFMVKLQNGPHAAKKSKIGSLINKIKKIPSLLSMKKQGFTIGYLKIKPITAPTLANDIIATQRTALIQQHAAHIDKNVVFCRSERWFKAITAEDMNAEIQNGIPDLENALITLVTNLYAENGITLKNPSHDHLIKMLQQSAACIRIHYKRLLDMDPKEIPQTLWTGTGGYIWDIILRCAVIAVHNGQVTGHDHGAGLAHVNNPFMAINELWGCTHFICINQNQAEEFSKRLKSWPKLDKKYPEVTAIKGAEKHAFAHYKKFDAPGFEIKTIVFLATLYGGDRVWAGPCSPDIVHLEWQINLVTKLIKLGYKVIVKIHPETATMPPPILTELGAEIRSEPLEDMIDEGDLILFADLYTSVFRSVLSTNIPMVLIDFYNHPWTEKGKELVQKRIGFLEAGFDENNKKTIDWNLMPSLITEAKNKHNNTEFFDYYYA